MLLEEIGPLVQTRFSRPDTLALRREMVEGFGSAVASCGAREQICDETSAAVRTMSGRVTSA